ncbi:MAG: hypothetical protein Q7U38_12380 [Methylobacter sp.]|nr:hypothetical protein [Methylobacter sp.]MDP2098433.1 hypothetical protein [Methylobacter sp.]MDP2427482.1 hypothetical protein [Methylobacter sp.]MDP3055064.1 hypothetical protein [Methylobacter sp.]MDP3361447.1 hypothetical protein [Methylobacter sp.]
MATHHSLRVRSSRWDKIEKKAWEFSIKANRVIKPTDVADALLSKFIDTITIEDVEKEKETR